MPQPKQASYKLMGLFQKLSQSFIHPLLLWRAGELDRLRFLREFEKSQFLSPEGVRELQRERLQAVIQHAAQNTPFYKERFSRHGLAPDSADDVFEQLKSLPPLTKSEIQKSCTEMISDGLDRATLIKNQTGGSTGEPIQFYLDKSRYEARMAAMLRHDGWAGMKVGDRMACIWGAPQDKPSNRLFARLRRRLLGKRLWLDTADITETKMRDFCESLKKFRPRTILAYANAILMFARFCEDNNLVPFQPHSIITSAEVLTAESRKTIERVFGCPVFNRYGCREFSIVATECEHHDGLHIMAEGLYLEIDEKTKTDDGSGDILVTDLLNFAMPMIRYRIGDRGKLDSSPCKCGRGLPRIQSIDGRVTDFILGETGQFVSGVFLATYLVAQRPSLGRVQIVQEEAGQALFRLKPTSKSSRQEDFSYVVQTAKEYLGKGAAIDVEVVDEFETTVSGKIQFSISRALPDFAAVNADR